MYLSPTIAILRLTDCCCPQKKTPHYYNVVHWYKTSLNKDKQKIPQVNDF